MTTKLLHGLAAAAAVALAGPALADPADDTLMLNGEIEMITRTAAPDHVSMLGELTSGWLYRDPETRDMQRDDFDNPGYLGVDAARDQWAMADGTEGKSCASCHDEPESMRGVRAVMPKFNEAKATMYTLEMYINDCRTERMGAAEWGWDDADMINMTALISSVSRGLPMSVAIDGPAAPFWEQGKEIYYTRFGQLELACSNCHEDHNGDYIRSDHLSQGQINGFPVYRLKDAKLSSIHNRFKGCVRDTRAETFKTGSPEFIALELYVASRGNGLSVEGPSIRN